MKSGPRSNRKVGPSVLCAIEATAYAAAWDIWAQSAGDIIPSEWGAEIAKECCDKGAGHAEYYYTPINRVLGNGWQAHEEDISSPDIWAGDIHFHGAQMGSSFSAEDMQGWDAAYDADRRYEAGFMLANDTGHLHTYYPATGSTNSFKMFEGR